MLTKVTITGADDNTDPSALAALSEEFPFVEWGILFSAKRQGSPRYPTPEWVRRNYDAATRHSMHFSAHFCGACTRDTLAGDGHWVDVLPLFFERVQLNGFAPTSEFARVVKEFKDSNLEWILPVRDEASIQPVANIARGLGDATLLYDPSGGRGVEAFRWPQQPSGVTMGYAGGIKPSNVEDVLRDIGPVDQYFWIDMESGVRVDDRLDMRLVREVLEKTAPLIKGAA